MGYAACYGMNPEDQKNLDVGTTLHIRASHTVLHPSLTTTILTKVQESKLHIFLQSLQCSSVTSRKTLISKLVARFMHVIWLILCASTLDILDSTCTLKDNPKNMRASIRAQQETSMRVFI